MVSKPAVEDISDCSLFGVKTEEEEEDDAGTDHDAEADDTLYVGSQRLHPIMAGSNVAEVFTCAFQHAIAIWIVVVVVVLSGTERAFCLTLRL